MCYHHEEWCKIWKGIDFSVQNWHEEFNKFWPEHSKIYKIYTLMGCIWPKYRIFALKKYRGVMFDDTEYYSKIWRKTDLCFQKWHEQFGKFSPEHLKVSKLGLWWDPFIQSRKCMSLKFTGELFFMIMKNDAKFEEELTCQFKIGMRNLTKIDEFWPEHSKISNICTLMGRFWPKYIMFELKKYRGVTFDGTEDWCKIWTDSWFQKWHEEFGKFWFTGWKIAILF